MTEAVCPPPDLSPAPPAPLSVELSLSRPAVLPHVAEDEPLHVHTVHILLHELSHILLGHKTVHVCGDLITTALPAPAPENAQASQSLNGLFRQVGYADKQEIEAETLSSLIQHRVYQQAGLAALSHAGQGSDMQQFMQGLGMDGGQGG